MLCLTCMKPWVPSSTPQKTGVEVRPEISAPRRKVGRSSSAPQQQVPTLYKQPKALKLSTFRPVVPTPKALCTLTPSTAHCHNAHAVVHLPGHMSPGVIMWKEPPDQSISSAQGTKIFCYLWNLLCQGWKGNSIQGLTISYDVSMVASRARSGLFWGGRGSRQGFCV